MIKLVLFVTQSVAVLCGPAPSPVYHSKGPNQLLLNEGEKVVTVSGHEFLTNVEPRNCASSCWWLGSKCQCCDSFSYNPALKSCYLKKRQNNQNNSTFLDSSGWQSYYYWGLVSNYPGGGYTGGLPEIAYAASISGGIGAFYDISYVSKGEGKLALHEGQPLKTTSGTDDLTGVGNKRCSEECNAVHQCDGYAYNKKLGVCYLKKNSGVGVFQTKDNSDGWTYYWKVDYDSTNSDCFCTCKSTTVCVLCKRDGSCDSI